MIPEIPFSKKEAETNAAVKATKITLDFFIVRRYTRDTGYSGASLRPLSLVLTASSCALRAYEGRFSYPS